MLLLPIGKLRINGNANLLFSRVEGIVESSGRMAANSCPAQRSQAGCGEVQIKKYEDKAIN